MFQSFFLIIAALYFPSINVLDSFVLLWYVCILPHGTCIHRCFSFANLINVMIGCIFIDTYDFGWYVLSLWVEGEFHDVMVCHSSVFDFWRHKDSIILYLPFFESEQMNLNCFVHVFLLPHISYIYTLTVQYFSS